jgi:non-specific serine/threonine protein kinase
VEKLDLSKFVNIEEFKEADKNLLPLLRKMQESEITKYLNRNSPFSGIWENIVHHEEDDLPEETKALMVEYLHPKLRKIFQEVAVSLFVFQLAPRQPFKTDKLEPLGIVPEGIKPFFKIEMTAEGYEIQCWTLLNGAPVEITENNITSSLIFVHDDNLFTWETTDDVNLVEKFVTKGKIEFTFEEWPEQLKKFVLPLTKEYHVDFDRSLISEVKDGEPDKRLVLQEKGDYLVFQPIFSYKGFETKPGGKDELIVPVEDKVLVVHRNREKENEFIEKLKLLHSNFILAENGSQLALKGTDVLKNNWFFLFVDAMRDMKIPTYGFEALKNFRFNTSKPQTRIHISSNTDWFDARVDIESFCCRCKESAGQPPAVCSPG